MEQAIYRSPSQLNVPHEDRDPALTTEPDLSSREDHHWRSLPSHATQLAVVSPMQREEAWQGESSGNRQAQQQQVQVGNVFHSVQGYNRYGWGRTQHQQWQQRGKQWGREKDLMEQNPCASSSNGCRRQGGQHGPPVHGPQCEQPGEAHCQGHVWRRDQQQQRTESLHQDQAGGQSGGGHEEKLLWNVKKHCLVRTVHVPAAMLREAGKHLRPMCMAGYCLPGMCTPYNTSQYIMDQHEYTWNDEEMAVTMSEGSSDYNTVDEDLPFTVPLPATAEDESTSTEEEEEESTQPAHQD